MSTSAQTVTLPPTLNHDACAQLVGDLNNARGQPLTINAGEVSQLGTLPAQLLIVARRSWGNEGINFEISNPSDGFLKSIRRLGIEDAVTGGV